jgi:prolyl-tRNA synthetase
MAPCAAGENEVALAPGYAANVEVASAEAQPVELPARLSKYATVPTPGLRTISEVSGFLGLGEGALLKAYPVVADGELVLVLVRGDHSINEIKLANVLGSEFRPAHDQEIENSIGPLGFLGPVGVDVRIILDRAVQDGGYVVGANRRDEHLRGVEPGRDFSFESADVRTVCAGDLVNGSPITIEPAIEIGNIFKLGTRYSEALDAFFLDEEGTRRPIVMGSYGIGPARIAAAAIEQNNDDSGIVWPAGIAPWDVEIVALGKPDSAEVAQANQLAEEIESQGLSVLVDDRDASPGEKFADADLLGCPLRLTVGRKGLERGVVEGRKRAGGDEELELATTASLAVDLWRGLN